MKTMHSLKLVLSTLMLLLVGAFAQAGVVTDTFNTNRNYVTNGVVGSVFDGVYFGVNPAEYPGQAGNAAGTTISAFASNSTLNVNSVQTAWENGGWNGVYFFRDVPGDFSLRVHVVPPINVSNFNTMGLQIRAARTNGQALTNGEGILSFTRFNEFGLGAYIRTFTNNVNIGLGSGQYNANTTDNSAAGPPFDSNYWLRIDRVGDNFNFYYTDDPTNTGWFATTNQPTIPRPDLTGLPVQVGLMHATFSANILPAVFSDFSITSTNFDSFIEPTSPSNVVTGASINNDLAVSWAPGTGSDGSVVVVWSGSATNGLKQLPRNGKTYNPSPVFGAGDILTGSTNGYYVAYVGAGTNVVISNTIGSLPYQIAVFSYTGAGGATSYSRKAVRASAVGPAVQTGITLIGPSSPVVVTGAKRAQVIASFNNGTTLDVSTLSNTLYSTAVPAVATVPTGRPGRISALSLGTNLVTVTNFGLNTTNIFVASNAFTVVAGSMTHRYMFNEPATDGGGNLTTNVSDSLGGANGTLIGGNTNTPFLTWQGNGALTYDGVGTYVQLPPNLFTNHGAITIETWMIDNGAAAARLIDAGSDTTHLVFLSDTVTGSINAGNGATAVTGTRNTVSNGSIHQVVWTQGGAGLRYSIWVDGVRTAINSNAVLTVENAGAEPTITLGTGKNNAFFTGAMDELRTYNYELDGLTIAAHAGYGVATTNNDPGNVTSFTLAVANSTNMVQDDSQASTVSATFSAFGNTLNVTTLTNVVYSSGNTNVVTINSNALVTAILPGDSFIQAVGTFPNSSPSVVTSALPIHVSAVTPIMQHRWSFNGDLVDSIGAANGGPANISFTNINGQNELVLSPTNNGTHASSYVTFPNDLLIAQSSVTMEIWYTERVRRQWARTWDFGSGTGNYLFQTPNSGASTRVAFLVPGSTPAGEQQVNSPLALLGGEQHVTYTLDAVSHTSKLYMNGVLLNVNTNTTDRARDMGSTQFDYLGRSQFGDPDFEGMINEFRIYNYALSAFQVLLNGAGADTFVSETNAGTLSTVTVVPVTNAMTVGGSQSPVVNANFTGISGVPVTGLASNWTSSDNTVLRVNSAGFVTAVGTGSATIAATWSNLSGTSASITVGAATAPVLGHRWSFTTDLSDSVGGANGSNAGTAVLAGAKLTLTGASNSYVRLPGHLFDTYTNATFEWWAATVPTSGTSNNPNNTRILDFGSDGLVNAPNTNNWFAFSLHGAGIAGTTFRWATDPFGIQSQHTYDSQANPVYNTNSINHYVWTFDTTGSGKAKIYVNGRLYDIFAISQFQPGPSIPSTLTNDVGYIGHGVQLTGTQPALSNFFGVIDEVRIWNGAMDQVQVQTSFQKGQDAASPIDPGAISSISTVVTDPTAIVGTIQRPRVTAQFANATNVDLTSSPFVSFSSSDSTKVKVTTDVDGAQRLNAVAAGSANIITSYGGKTATNAVTVIAAPALQLTHRWQFNSNAVDFIGNATPALLGQATIQSNGVFLTGTKIPTTYVDLGPDLVSGYDKLTLEMFADYGANAVWANAFAFGERSQVTDNGIVGIDYSFTTPANGANVLRTGTLAIGGAEAQTDGPVGFVNTKGTQIVLTIDSTSNIQTLYANGVLAAVGTNANFNNLNINDRQTILGRSFFNDPNTIASIKDFRIYYGVMTSNQVASSFALGADPETPKIVADGLGNAVISWPDDSLFTAGYHLQRTLNLSPTAWQNVNVAPVTNSGIISVTVPASATNSAFFRLAKP